jgi:tRNA A37 threonylcarbamoyladenosine dehydratase
MSFSRLIDQIGPDAYQRLHRTTVAIVGLGGVGGSAAEAIARLGVGRVILVDGDVVEASNLNRQLVALHSTIGKKKVDVMADRIRDIHPACDVIACDWFVTKDTLPTLFAFGIDCLIDAIDSMRDKVELLAEAASRDVMTISVTGTGDKQDLSRLEVMPLAKTTYDPIARILRQKLRHRIDIDRLMVVVSTEPPAKNQDVPHPSSNPFVPNAAGLLAAQTVFHHVLKTT